MFAFKNVYYKSTKKINSLNCLNGQNQITKGIRQASKLSHSNAEHAQVTSNLELYVSGHPSEMLQRLSYQNPLEIVMNHA